LISRHGAANRVGETAVNGNESRHGYPQYVFVFLAQGSETNVLVQRRFAAIPAVSSTDSSRNLIQR
jgi:hypothetical protein